MSETTTPEEIEFQTEEHRILDMLNAYPEPVVFSVPGGGATALRNRLKRCLRNLVLNPTWPTNLDRGLAYKVLQQYTFVADSKTALYAGLPRRSRTPILQTTGFELPVIKFDDPEVLKALLLLKNFDHISFPIKIETTLPVHDIKVNLPFPNAEIADSIHENCYTIV